MQTDMILHTCAGGMKLVYIQQFSKMIPHTKIDQSTVVVSHHSEDDRRAFFDPSFGPPPIGSFKRESYELKKFFEGDLSHFLRIDQHFERTQYRMQEQAHEDAFKKIQNDLKPMIAKKEIKFSIKDLTLESVNNLAEEYARGFGGDACGLHINLSPYQKFFVIADPSSFMFYRTEYKEHRVELPGDLLIHKGILVDLKPETWVMGRYEDLTYLKELSSMQRYVGPSFK